MSDDFDWYSLQLNVGIVPPEKQKITTSQIRLDFNMPINKIGGWHPNDQFSAYKKIASKSEIEAFMSTKIATELIQKIPYLDNLIPQFSIKYQRYVEKEKTPKTSVIRVVSDYQRKLQYDLAEDPKTKIDIRQLTAQILFGTKIKTKLDDKNPLLSLSINCRCGLLRLKEDIIQDVDIVIRK